MERFNFKLAASAVMIICAANGAQAAAGEAAGSERPDEFTTAASTTCDPLGSRSSVLSAFVNVDEETVTLRGLHFGKKTPTVFCETEKMMVLRWSDTEIVVRFPKAVKDGTYLFTVARGNLNHETR